MCCALLVDLHSICCQEFVSYVIKLCNHVFSVSVEFCPSFLPDCNAPVRFGRVLLVVMEVHSLLNSRPC